MSEQAKSPQQLEVDSLDAAYQAIKTRLGEDNSHVEGLKRDLDSKRAALFKTRPAEIQVQLRTNSLVKKQKALSQAQELVADLLERQKAIAEELAEARQQEGALVAEVAALQAEVREAASAVKSEDDPAPELEGLPVDSPEFDEAKALLGKIQVLKLQARARLEQEAPATPVPSPTGPSLAAGEARAAAASRRQARGGSGAANMVVDLGEAGTKRPAGGEEEEEDDLPEPSEEELLRQASHFASPAEMEDPVQRAVRLEQAKAAIADSRRREKKAKRG